MPSRRRKTMVTMAFPPQFVVLLQIARHVSAGVEKLTLFGVLDRACSSCDSMDEPTGPWASCHSRVSNWVASEMTAS